MVIDYIIQLIRVLFNKYRRGFIKLTQITVAVKAAYMDIFNEALEEYKKSNSDVIPQVLKRFVTVATVNVINGAAAVPTGFVKELSFMTDTGFEGDFLHPEEFDDRKTSLILPPTSEKPIAKVMNSQIVVEPASTSRITLTYIRVPNDFVYAVTTDGDGRGEVFNSGGSTDIEFGLEYANPIARRAAEYLGVGFQNPDVVSLKQ